MEGKVYHASKNPNLTELDPNKSKHKHNHGKSFLYATTSKELAMIFSMRTTDLYTVVSGKGTPEDPVVFVERLPGVFDRFLHNPTTIYELSGEDFHRGGTAYDGEVVTEEKQQILGKEEIEDVYSRLIEMEKSGTVTLYHYPDRPVDIPLDNSDLIEDRLLPSYRSAQGPQQRLDIIRQMLQAHPKLFSKVMQSIISENMNSIGNKFREITTSIRDKFQAVSKRKALPEPQVKENDSVETLGDMSTEKEENSHPSWYLGPEKEIIKRNCDKIGKNFGMRQNSPETGEIDPQEHTETGEKGR